MIIAVPHRDLYERKSSPPSRFNADHKRFYTPASLLSEVEAALPVGGYRIRSLKDVDENFDYTVPPERHAVGCYEIELVLEKIAVPHYAELLRESPVVENIIAIYATLVWDATIALRLGRDADLKQIREFLSSLPLPPFTLLTRRLEDLTPYGNRPLRHELQSILKHAIERAPFDRNWYLEAYADVAEWVKTDPVACPRSHFIVHGYFEGRSPSLEASLFLRRSSG